MRMDENDSFFKLKEQLEDAQKLMGRMEQYIVEARGVLQSCIRRQSEFQYAYLGDMIQETAKTSERLTDKLRRMTLEIVVNPKEYEKYKEDLVLIHGIELEYKDEILRVSAPVLIPHRKDCYTDYLYKPLHTAFRNWCMQRAEEKLEIPTYTNCTICFVHVYDETLPLARVRDHDNYEEKHVQDMRQLCRIKQELLWRPSVSIVCMDYQAEIIREYLGEKVIIYELNTENVMKYLINDIGE